LQLATSSPSLDLPGNAAASCFSGRPWWRGEGLDAGIDLQQ
jgi:hypothetical protein